MTNHKEKFEAKRNEARAMLQSDATQEVRRKAAGAVEKELLGVVNI
jgi:hypothetical protein